MYHHIIGKLYGKTPDEVIIETSGIGYTIRIPGSTYDNLPPEGSECFLYLHLAKREDGDILFGFHSPQERRMFLLLNTVKRVGPALSLSILTAMPVNRLAGTIKSRDVKLLSSLKGLGKTSAERIVVDLSTKVDDLALETAQYESPVHQDAIGALEALGIDRVVASRVISDLLAEFSPEAATPDLQKLIVSALRRIQGGK